MFWRVQVINAGPFFQLSYRLQIFLSGCGAVSSKKNMLLLRSMTENSSKKQRKSELLASIVRLEAVLPMLYWTYRSLGKRFDLLLLHYCCSSSTSSLRAYRVFHFIHNGIWIRIFPPSLCHYYITISFLQKKTRTKKVFFFPQKLWMGHLAGCFIRKFATFSPFQQNDVE